MWQFSFYKTADGNANIDDSTDAATTANATVAAWLEACITTDDRTINPYSKQELLFKAASHDYAHPYTNRKAYIRIYPFCFKPNSVGA